MRPYHSVVDFDTQAHFSRDFTWPGHPKKSLHIYIGSLKNGHHVHSIFATTGFIVTYVTSSRSFLEILLILGIPPRSRNYLLSIPNPGPESQNFKINPKLRSRIPNFSNSIQIVYPESRIFQTQSRIPNFPNSILNHEFSKLHPDPDAQIFQT